MKANSCKMVAICAAMFVIAKTGAVAQPNSTAPVTPPPPVQNVAPAPAMPIEAAPAAIVTPPPAVTPAAPPSAVEVPTGGNPTPTGIQPAENNTISIALDNVPVNQVVQMFARAANANIVAPTLPSTNVTVHLENVQWEPALSEILGSVGLALMKRQSGIYTVVAKEEMGSEPMKSDIIFLNYTTSSNVLPVVERMIAGMSNSTVAGFSGANALVIRAPESALKQIMEVIGKLDKPHDQVMIECKFVELNDQAIKDLGINWQSLQGWTVGVQSPQMQYNKTTTARNSINKDNQTHNVGVNTAVNYSLPQNGPNPTVQNASGRSGSQANIGNGAADGHGSGGTGTTITGPNTDYTAAQSQINNSGSMNVSGQGFSSVTITPASTPGLPNTVTPNVVPQTDNLKQNLDYGQTEVIKALSAILSADTFQATLSALQQNTGVEVVSNPKIIVASGRTAVIHVGQNQPNVTANQQPGVAGGSAQITYQLDQAKPWIEIGVKLKVTATLNTSNNISLKLAPELSRISGTYTVPSVGTTYPITEIREITTEFNIQSGHTVALGGLTQTSDTEVVKKIPVLGDIPLIGTYLFRHTHKEKIQDEVIIFVTASAAMPESLAQVSGIPEEAKLIHRHLAKKVEEAAKAEELATKKTPKATLPK